MKNPLSLLSPRLRTRSPSMLKAIAEMEDEMNQWYQDALTGLPEGVGTRDFAPVCNLKENDKEYIAQFDVPGVKKEDLKIEIADNRLTVRGERKEEKEEKTVRNYISESYYGSFMRSFTLPTSVDENKIEANYAEGVLTVKIPKVAASKIKEVKVH